uniref:Uncharacterized protein n=1 Tax=Anguilla anguilla TaxID=7936 RepID=A0A0E9VEY9_ANGAN
MCASVFSIRKVSQTQA